MHNWAFISAYITSIITSFYSRYKYNIAPYIDDHIFELRRIFFKYLIHHAISCNNKHFELLCITMNTAFRF